MSYADMNYEARPQRNSSLVYHAAYASYAVSLVGLFPFVFLGLILAYAQRKHSLGGPIERHTDWLVGTFWWCVPFWIVGGILSFIFLGWLILIPLWIWSAYRVLRGWIALANNANP